MSDAREGKEKAERGEEAAEAAGAEAIVRGVTEMMAAAAQVGVSVAKAFADATAAKRPVPPPPESARPLEAFVHYGVAAVTNIIGLVTTGAGLAEDAAPAAPREAKGGLPRVARGSVLRVPLSIENPGSEAMSGLTAVCTRLEGPAGQGGLTARALRFEPEVLSVAARDFEKLTVYVDVPGTAAPGRYEATIGLGHEGFETRLAFEVVA